MIDVVGGKMMLIGIFSIFGAFAISTTADNRGDKARAGGDGEQTSANAGDIWAMEYSKYASAEYENDVTEVQ